MKVIKEGRGFILEVTCTGKGNGGGGCGAFLGIEQNDVYITTSSDYTGDVDYFYTIKCPCCGTQTDIPSHKLPSNVKDAAMNMSRGRILGLRR